MTDMEGDVSSPEPFGFRLVTSDPERAVEALQDTYRVTGGVRISGDTDGFRYAQRVRNGDGFAVTRFQCTMTVGYRGPLGGLLCIGQVHGGTLSFRTSRGELRAGVGDVCLAPPHEDWRATTDDVDVAPVMLDRAEVAAFAAALGDIGPDDLRFTGLVPVSSGAARHWKATVTHVGDDVLGNPEVAASPLVRAQAFRMLVTGLLTTFPNTAVHALAERPGPGRLRSEPAVLRRAMEFIDSNAHRPIGLTEITEAARIGVRGLQHLFARHRGQTPLQYLRRVRMDHAHRELVDADPTRGDTVATIAARWGFAHAGRFSVQYRQVYGRSPSDTLRA